MSYFTLGGGFRAAISRERAVSGPPKKPNLDSSNTGGCDIVLTSIANGGSMLDEQAVKLEARLLALEYFVAESFRLIYGILGASPETVKLSQAHMRKHLQTIKSPHSDPAISDLAAAELQEAFERLLDKVGPPP